MAESAIASIIFPVKNEGENVKKTLESFFSASIGQPYELIIVDDQSNDQCCEFLKTEYLDKNIILVTTDGVGAANARNEGAKLARGEVLVFCDAHLEFEDYWLDLLIEPLLKGLTDAVTPAIGAIGNPHFTGYGQTLWVNERSSKIRTHWNVKQDDLFETAILPGGCFAINRSVFEDAGGFETGFPVWGYEDVEISIKLWLFGYKCHVQPKAKVLHLFRKVQPYRVELDDYFYNLLRLSYLHFNSARIYKVRKMLINGNQKEIENRVLANGALEKKKSYLARRKYDDDWFFTKFNIFF
ncbi:MULTISPECIES: glycosyltransferase [Bacillaceae]|uniref:Glycosyltransferase n=1 Tax=Bacillus infantis TaxID=324767 RepID=A0A5D4SPZ8_9BACI|nr:MULTISPECIES: glycosyltransferase [Bacillus]MCA1036823.1 glycosyltransferase [Bacillus infantis]MDW2878464.1 glycosyltransferase [Bacillus infantis]TYS65380.1 glycosyltransferase [Bacillus infantis]